MSRNSSANNRPADPLAGGERGRLLKPTTIVLLAVAVGSMLLLLFPEIDFSEPDLAGKPSELTTEYLRVLLRSKPHDNNLRLRLGQNQLALGHLEACRETLKRLMGLKGVTAMHARITFLEATKGLYHRHEKYSRRPILLNSCKLQLERLLQDPLGENELKKLTGISLEFGLARITGELYDRLGAADPVRKSHWYATAGHWYIASGRYQEGSRAYMRSSSTAASKGEALGRSREAMEAWVAAGRPDQALILCQELMRRFPKDNSLLRRAVALALASNQPHLALKLNGQLMQRYPRSRRLLERQISLSQAAGDLKLATRLNGRLLARHPNSKRLLRRQVALVRASGDNEGAYLLARRLLALDPDNRRARLEVARLALWTARPDEALRTHLWLAARGSRMSRRKALELARALKRPGLVVHLMGMARTVRSLTRAESLELIGALESLGEPAEAATELERFLQKSPQDLDAWTKLADLRQQMGQPVASLEASLEITRQAGLSRKEIIRQAQILWLQGRPHKAMARLRQFADLAGKKDRVYWDMMGALAWDLGANKEVHRAYGPWMTGSGAIDKEAAEHFIVAALEQGHYMDALAVARRLNMTTGTTRPLLLVVEAMARDGRWADLERAMSGLRASTALQGERRFWLVEARLARHRGETWRVKAALARALKLDPKNREARLAWGWLMLDSGDEDELRLALRLWRDAAHRDPRYWPLFAVGQERLGQPRRALRFWRWLAQRNPRDIQYVTSYADALERQGRKTRAWRLRRYVLHRLQEEARETLAGFVKGARASASRGKLSQDLTPMRDRLLAFGKVVWKQQGAELARRWLHPALHYAHYDPTIQRFAVGWNLARNNLDRARHWMDRQIQRGERPDPHQRLTLAMAEGDGSTLSSLLGSNSAGLGVLSRIFALMQIGRRQEALRLARSHVARASLPPGNNRSLLGTTLLSLEQAVGSRVKVDGGWESLGTMDMLALRLATQIQLGDFVIEATAGSQTLLTSPGGALLDGAFERFHMRVGGAYVRRTWSARINLGMTITEEGQYSFSPGLLLEYRPWSNVLAQVEGVYGGPADETAALRLYGLRSRVLGRLQVAITRRLDSDISASWVHYTDLNGGLLGQGLAAQGALGYSLSLLNPLLRVRWGASGGQHWVQPALPGGMAAGLTPGSTMDAVLPEKFFTTGIGATIAQVLLGGWNRPGPQLRCQLDAWIGYWYPAHLLTYRLEAGIIWRFLARHDLVAGFSYGNQQGAAAGQPSAAVNLKYEYHFSP